MSDLFAWVPWFKELAQKITAGGEKFLSEQAAKVDWKTNGVPPLLRNGPENIDPFSFFYYLAAKSARAASRQTIYPSVDTQFGTSFNGDLEDDESFVFPVPPAITALFRDGNSFHPQRLWRLFRAAASGIEAIREEEFNRILRFKGIKFPKLTQVLFLVDPYTFLPCDDKSAFALCENHNAVTDWATYKRELAVVRGSFPGLHPYEINRASYLMLGATLDRTNSRAWQTSTYVDGTPGDDYWDEFRMSSSIYHRGPGKNRSRRLHEPRPGDLVLAHAGRRGGRGIGVVYRNGHKGDWAPDQRMHMLWLNAETADLAGNAKIGAFSGAGATTDVFQKTSAYRPTFDLLDRLGWTLPISGPDLGALAEEVLLSESDLRKIKDLLDDKKQVIFQGPPGTGKTYLARKLAACLAGHDDRVRLVQFHPSYAYEDFVQGYRPTLTEDGRAGFKLRDGPLLKMAKTARKEPDAKFFLVIDEINRGNLSKILGELYFLLEYRDHKMQLQYRGKPFALPPNLYFIGTMNTADRSIALVDLALRRRFHFVEFHPDKDLIKGLLGRWLNKHGLKEFRWLERVVQKANEKLDDRHAAIGPSYFMPKDKKLDDERVRRIWKHNVLPYIEERLFGQLDGLNQFDLDKLREEIGDKSADEGAPETSEPADANP